MLFRSRRSHWALLPALLFACAGAAMTAAVPVESAGDSVDRLNHAAIQRPSLRLPGPAQGEAAVRLLGPRLNAVAARYGGLGAGLAAILRRDPDLWLDAESRLLYGCRLGADPEKEKERPAYVAGATFPQDETFELHSLPGSNRVIYLDFDGHLTRGTEWNRREGDIRSVPWSLDGDRSNFNSTELAAIQQVWQGVAEDFAAFDVDVTTQDPGVERLRRSSTLDEEFGIRVVISPTDHFFPRAGGVAYVGSFAWDSDTPCFAFTNGLEDDPKAINEASSHEVGHTLGLSHDGIVRGTGYYDGHGDWAPIMGVGYYRPVSQWSKGEYANANNREDDLAVMPSYGCSQRLDDAGDTAATAVPMQAGVEIAGVISNRTDVDYFSFEFAGGPAAIQANPAPLSPNLNIKLTLFGANNQQIAEASGESLSEQIGRTLPAGTYFVRVDGEGVGTASTGYTDYASIGQYTLKVSLASSVSGSVREPGGVPVPGIQFLLKNEAGNVVGRTTSGASGAFNFAGVVEGRYSLSAVNASYVITPGVTAVIVPPSRTELAFTATPIPVEIVSLKVKPSKVHGGRAARGTVTVNVPASAKGVVVQLSSDKPQKASVPQSVLVPAGLTTIDFAVATVRTRKKIGVKITATAGSSTQTAKLTLL